MRELGISVRHLACLVGVDPRTVRGWRRGEHKTTEDEHRRRLEAALSTDAEVLFQPDADGDFATPSMASEHVKLRYYPTAAPFEDEGGETDIVSFDDVEEGIDY